MALSCILHSSNIETTACGFPAYLVLWLTSAWKVLFPPLHLAETSQEIFLELPMARCPYSGLGAHLLCTQEILYILSQSYT